MSLTFTAPAKPKALDFNAVAQIAGALGRLKELSELAIQTKAHEAEIRGIHEYLANTFLNHGEEFLGCWFTVRREYEPLLKAISTIAYRVGKITAQVVPLPAPTTAPEGAAEQPVEVAEAKPDNVIDLGTLPRA